MAILHHENKQDGAQIWYVYESEFRRFLKCANSIGYDSWTLRRATYSLFGNDAQKTRKKPLYELKLGSIINPKSTDDSSEEKRIWNIEKISRMSGFIKDDV